MTNKYYKKSYTQKQQKPVKQSSGKPDYLKMFFGAFFMMLVLFVLLAVHLFASVDTAIGENDEGDLKESGLGVKHLIDSRLKFLQLEDKNMLPEKAPEVDNAKEREMSTYTNSNDEVKVEPYSRNDNNYGTNNSFTPSQSNFSDTTIKHPTTTTAPQPVHTGSTVYKVYIGTYSTLEQARVAQNIIQDANLGVTSFVKTLANGAYTVQVGSYTDYNKASTLTNELKHNHFPARLVQE